VTLILGTWEAESSDSRAVQAKEFARHHLNGKKPGCGDAHLSFEICQEAQNSRALGQAGLEKKQDPLSKITRIKGLEVEVYLKQ
jgi:hypothetical protein